MVTSRVHNLLMIFNCKNMEFKNNQYLYTYQYKDHLDHETKL